MSSHSRMPGRFTAALALALFLAASAAWPQAQDLSVEQAVQAALDGSSDIQGALADARSSAEKAVASRLRMLPSLTLSGGYTRLSDVGAVSLDIPANSFFPGSPQASFPFPASPLDSISFAARLQYPVFAGFRLTEAAKIADLQTTTREAAVDVMKRALAFEVRRAYWEAVRAAASVDTAAKGLELANAMSSETKALVTQGLAMASDQLAADQRRTQAQISLNDAASFRNQAFLVLASMLGRQDAARAIVSVTQQGGQENALPYALVSRPDANEGPAAPADAASAVSQALSRRPEMRISSLSTEMADHAAAAAAAGLYPTLAVVGDYTYANPNQRIFPPSAVFTGTWELGVQLSFDVGGLPSTLAQMSSAEQDASKARLQAEKQQRSIILDVQTCLLALDRARSDLELTLGAVPQAEENLRVVQQKFSNGVAKHSEVLEAELGLARARFSVESKQVDVRIAEADLTRAEALDSF